MADRAPPPVVRLLPRDGARLPTLFKRGAHAPYAIRWFGSTALLGHVRHLVAAAVASESVDTRDWMRAQEPHELLHAAATVLGATGQGSSLTERLGRAVWIDFVADTGDDRDLSLAVARMVFSDFEVPGSAESGEARTLPRGDVLLFGGDTAYPVATANEIHRRITVPWNGVLHTFGAVQRRRVLLGVPGNHDWYDGLDGFARLFRKSPLGTRHEGTAAFDEAEGPRDTTSREPSLRKGRKRGLLARQLHLDELGGSLGLAADAAKAVGALALGVKVARRKRLHLRGYDAVQESSYWALPLAPGIEAWGVDRQLRTVDFRQRTFFRRRANREAGRGVLFCSADPAVAFGERNEPGATALAHCGLALGDDPLLFIAGDMHHYERCTFGPSTHVVAGGGGAFLHGTRIGPYPRWQPDLAYPDGATSRRLVVQMPLQLLLGQAGFLPHMTFAGVAFLEIMALLRSPLWASAVTVFLTAVMVTCFYLNAGHGRAHPRRVAAVALPFGLGLGIAPVLASTELVSRLPVFASVPLLVLAYACLGAFGFGLFLMTLAITGLEHQQAFAALGHPGFKHFVRLCVHPDGHIEGWTIGKDDPLAEGPPVLVDHFVWVPGAEGAAGGGDESYESYGSEAAEAADVAEEAQEDPGHRSR